MALKVNGLEGTNGTGITAGNSDDVSGDAFALVAAGSGGTIAYTTTDALYGSTCGQFTQPTAANQPVTVQLTDAAGSTDFATRIFLRITGYPSAQIAFPFQVRSTADAQICSVNMTTTGTLRILNAAGTTLSIGTTALSLNTWYRVEFYGSGLNGSAGTLTAAFYLPTDTTAIESITASSLTLGGPVDRVRYGRMGAATLATWKIDEIALNVGSSTPIGPAAITAIPLPAVLTRAVTIPTPTIGITADVTITPPVVTPTVTVNTPNALSNLLVPTTVVPATTTVNTPTVLLSKIITPATVAAVTTVQPLAATVQATVLPDTVTCAAVVPLAAFGGTSSAVVTPTTFNRPARIHTPSLIVPGALVTVTPTVLARTVTVLNATARLGQLPRPQVLQVATAVNTPSVILGRFVPTFYEWDGATAVELDIQGVWTGVQIDPAAVVEVFK